MRSSFFYAAMRLDLKKASRTHIGERMGSAETAEGGFGAAFSHVRRKFRNSRQNLWYNDQRFFPGKGT